MRVEEGFGSWGNGQKHAHGTVHSSLYFSMADLVDKLLNGVISIRYSGLTRDTNFRANELLDMIIITVRVVDRVIPQVR